MATRKAKTYSRITDYLEDRDPELYEVVHTLCLEHLFIPKGKPGITFISPQEEEFRRQLTEWSISDDDATRKLASDHIAAMIIHDVFKTPSDFRKQDEIVNALRQVVDVDGKNASTTEVKFKNGARASIDRDFKEACKKDNLCVYHLTSGRIPIDAPAAKSRPSKRTKGGKQEVKQQETPVQDSLRFGLGVEVETAYAYRRAHEGPQSDEYRDTVVSFLSFLFKHKDRKMASDILYERVLPLVSRQWAADFYLLFEPKTVANDYIIPEPVLEEWYALRRKRMVWDFSDTVTRINKYLDQFAKDTKGQYPAVYSNRFSILNAIDDERRELEDRSCLDLVTKCRETYVKLIDKNAIGDVSNIFPAGLLELYRKDKDRKLLEDEFRQYLLLEFNRLERMSGNEFMTNFGEITDTINDYLVNVDRGEFISCGNRLRIFNIETARCSTSDMRRHLANEFVMSSNFIHIPLSAADLASEEFPHEEYSVVRPSPNKPDYWNIEMLVAKRNDRIAGPAVKEDGDATSKALEKFLRKHGDGAGDEVKKYITDALKAAGEKKPAKK